MSSEETILALQAMKNGDMSQFDKFYEQTKKTVFFAAYAVLKDQSAAEDVLQDVYVKVLETLDRIELDRGVISLLAVMSRNMALNRIKESSKKVELTEDIPAEEENKTPYRENELFDLMKKVLDDSEYEIVILHVVDDLKHREIAEALSLPLGTVTWKYNNALKKLKKELEND